MDGALLRGNRRRLAGNRRRWGVTDGGWEVTLCILVCQ